jgi:hypothetical protein
MVVGKMKQTILRRDGFSVDGLLGDMIRKDAKVKILIIDAARRSPFERRFRASLTGLAAIDTPEGTTRSLRRATGTPASLPSRARV